MDERKSMGDALLDVFDAGVSLVKSEINGIVKKAGEIAKVKGIGIALVLAATAPLSMGLIFLILFFFFGLMRLGLGAWAAALVIALLSFGVTVALILLGASKLSAEMSIPNSKTAEIPDIPEPIPAAASGIPVNTTPSYEKDRN